MMKSKTTVALSTAAIAALALLFAAGPIVGSQQASAFVSVHGHGGYYHGHYFYRHPYYRHPFYHPFYHHYHPFYRGHYFYHRY